ncbi:MAG: hypothetical protein NVS2B4_02970 [Ramlibacter sp.]
MTAVELIYFNAGGGHRAAAAALDSVIRQKHPHWQVRRTNIIDVLDPRGRFRQLTGMAPEDYYNKRLATGATIGLQQELKVLQALIRLGEAAIMRALQQHWLQTEPDLVVSLIPNFNRPLCKSLGATVPGTPFVTVMTDLADYPPNFWIVPGQSQHIVCGTAHAVEQARRLGCDQARVHRVSGMILRPDFYAAPLADRDAERRALGLDPGRHTGLVLFGGHGSSAMATIARDLQDVQLILLCGHNERLRKTLQALPSRAPRALIGFTPDVRHYMHLADFFVGKPGPGSLSEAVHAGLPVVTVRNRWTLPQERFNTDWVLEHGLGVVAPSMRKLRAPVLGLIAHLPTYRDAVLRMEPNRALFEVPTILERLLREGARNVSASAALSLQRATCA